MLIDMLNVRSDSGFEYYSFYTAPVDILKDFVDFKSFNYILIMKGISNLEAPDILNKVRSGYVKVAEANSPGGKSGTGGLTFEIYARKSHDE
jgi:hypothetical protein